MKDQLNAIIRDIQHCPSTLMTNFSGDGVEAFFDTVVAAVDVKMNQTAALIENDPSDSNWIAYQRSLERKFYRNRVLYTD